MADRLTSILQQERRKAVEEFKSQMAMVSDDDLAAARREGFAAGRGSVSRLLWFGLGACSPVGLATLFAFLT